MMFQKELAEIKQKLDVPMPERLAIINEIASDLNEAYAKLIASGKNPDEARRLTLDEMRMDNQVMSELSAVYETSFARLLRMLPQNWAKGIYEISGMLPLFAFIWFTKGDMHMLEFLREGGWPAVVSILLMGGLGLSMDLRHAFRWFVLRDHSKSSLGKFSHWPLYLAAGTLLLGVVGAAAGYRIVFVKWSQGVIPPELIRAGLAEPLAGVITAATMAGAIVLVHGWLSAWKHSIIYFLHRDDESASKPWL
jgi:hypothetical protein